MAAIKLSKNHKTIIRILINLRYNKLINQRGEKMAKVCPLKGCDNTPGMCIHDKIMIVVAVVIVAVIVAKLLNLF